MIDKDTIKNLADLARIEMNEVELEKMTRELDPILGYVGQINAVTGDLKPSVSKHRNIMRDDVVTTESREYTEKILKNAPARDGDYIQVKKIL
jgi:aspartyl-tRNA(Asn)/glutamyl-tRNA(Gln) amidotransferase subunit C